MIYLRRLHPTKDVGIKYQKWMNDTEVQKYTEQKHKRHSLKDIKNFSVQISMDVVEHLIKNSIDKSKLEKIYSKGLEQAQTTLKNTKF